jgi:Uma2 family endonuclease
MNLALAELELPIRIHIERPMTDEQLARFCSSNDPLQVERDANGELVVMSPTFTEGGEIHGKVGGYLFIWTLADGRGKYFGASTGFILPDTSMRSADAAWISLHRWNSLTEDQRKGFARVCPEFVIEVRSATDRLFELQEKMAMWIANGADLAWLVDPQRRVVEIYRAGEAVEVYENPTSVQGTGCVSGFCLVMESVWG